MTGAATNVGTGSASQGTTLQRQVQEVKTAGAKRPGKQQQFQQGQKALRHFQWHCQARAAFDRAN
jgi:hypothetical protein